MRLDARAAKLLQPGQHIVIDGCPGLRLVATATRRTWTYRYKSPTDGRMRQVALGGWPAMALAAAAGAWAAAGKKPSSFRKEKPLSVPKDVSSAGTAPRPALSFA